MKVAHCCGYSSERAVTAGTPRPRKPPFWEAYMFCHAVKSGEFHRTFYIPRKSGQLDITSNNFNLVRPIFGAWAATTLPTFSKDSFLIVPVPSKKAQANVETYKVARNGTASVERHSVCRLRA